MPGSINVALRKAVTEGLTAHLGAHEDFNGTAAPEDEVEVSYGYSLNSTAAQRVYTGFARADTDPALMKSGRVHRKEQDATFDLIVRVEVPGGNLEDSDTRAFALGAEVEEWVADHKNSAEMAAAGVPVDGLNWMYVAGWDSRNSPSDSGAETLLVYRIAWSARLT